MTDQSRSRERRDQKNRTREAILAAARRLLADGAPVTLNAAAGLAGVSRATAYRYFSDPGVLSIEAGLAVEVKSYDAVTAGCETTRARLLAISLYFFDLAIDHEAEFRAFLARWLDAWMADGSTPGRGARRVEMVHRALDDGSEDIGPEARAALVRGLTMSTGTEAMIALFDIAQTDRAAARQTVEQVARLVIDRHLPPDG